MRAVPGPKVARLALLGALYVGQGLPFGFQATALPVYLRERGVSLGSIGLLGALALPWALKALWAPLVDRAGARRRVIVPCQLGMAAAAFAAAFVRPDGAGLLALLGLVFLLNLLAATQDIAVDGLAVDWLSGGELGPANAAQVVGYKVGMLVGGGLLVWASAWIGFRGLFLAMGALMLALAAVALLAREPHETAASRAARQSLGAVLRALRDALSAPGTGWLLAFVLTYKLGETLVDAMFKPFLTDAGFPAPTIGLWLGTWGMVASLAGSAAGGYLAMRVPLVAAVGLSGAARAASVFGEWALAAFGPPSPSEVIAVTLAEHAAGGMLTTAMFAFMMSRTDARIGGTHFTLLASVEVVGKALAGAPSGFLAEALGYDGLFLLGAVLSAAFLALVPWLRRSESPRPAPG